MTPLLPPPRPTPSLAIIPRWSLLCSELSLISLPYCYSLDTHENIPK